MTQSFEAEISPLVHLASAVFLNADRDASRMVFYSAYYDASSAEQVPDEPLVVAGLLSTVNRWAKFETEWNAILGEFGVPYFRMVEYSHSMLHFKSWKGDNEKRAAFMARLISALETGVQKAFVFHMMPSEFDAVDAEFDLSLVAPDGSRAGVYGMSALLCIQQSKHWLEDTYPKHRTQHVVEEGDPGQALVAWLARQKENATALRLSIQPAYDPELDEWFVPFQAADLVASEWRLHLLRERTGSTRPPRKSFLMLQQAVPTVVETMVGPALRRMCLLEPNEWPRRVPSASVSSALAESLPPSEPQ